MKNVNLTTQKQRAQLKVTHNPHFMMLEPGFFLGWRPTSDTWCARYRRAGTKGRGHEQALALPKGTAFPIARAAADAWKAQLTGSARRVPKLEGTVGEALLAAIAAVRELGKEHTARNMEKKFRLSVFGNPDTRVRPDEICFKKLSTVTNDDFEEWRARIGHERKPQTVNLHARLVRAGLNRAVNKLGYVGNPNAWRLEKLDEDDPASADYLSLKQRAAYLQACAAGSARSGDAVANFGRGMLETGARPIDLARATVANFDPTTKRIHLKTRKGRKWRHYSTRLSPEGAAFVKSLCRDKLPSAPLFPAPDGSHWRGTNWVNYFADARERSNRGRSESDPLYLPQNVRAYSFRHSKITDMLKQGVDSLVVAKETGTSLKMLAEHYYHVVDADDDDEDSHGVANQRAVA